MERASYIFDQSRSDKLDQSGNYDWGLNFYAPVGGQVWINYKGWFSLEMLYKRMFEWFKENGYVDTNGAGENIEQYYAEKREADGGIGELWYWWRAETTPDNNKMFRYRIFVDVQILGLAKDTYVTDGQKFSMNNGEISVFIRPYLDMELDNKTKKSLLGDTKTWQDHSFTNQFTKWFKNRIYKYQVEDRKIEFYDEIQDFIAIIKQFFKLNNFAKPRDDMHPRLGIPQYKLGNDFEK